MNDSKIDDAVASAVAVLRAEAAEADRSAVFPAAGVRNLRESGLMGLLVPEEFGGHGAGLDVYTTVAGELAGACLSTAMIWTMHCQQVDALVRFAARDLQRRVLPAVAAGEIYLASVTTERAKGGHLVSAHAPLHADGAGHYLVDREAPVVTGGTVAEAFLMTMRAGESAPDGEVTLLYADRADLDITGSGAWDPLGMRATESSALHLRGRVPAGNVVGGPGGFGQVGRESMAPLAHLGWSACWLGAARGALRDVLHQVARRTVRIDVGSDLVRERLARIRMDLELVSAYLSATVEEVSAARRSGRSLADPAVQIHLDVLKVAAAERCFEAVSRLVKLTGLFHGYNRAAPVAVERVFRDLRSASLNYADDRLLSAIGSLQMLDRGVGLLRRPAQAD